ncbi:TonB-dependent receptor [Telmatobacter sp. DSM 110680]|uniref:TonB-dependent receptor n=1 Tax=Telmatobacter sp. DSM 110680 TaxID=3036704 RepID=A0AAU7DS92_9BACT
MHSSPSGRTRLLQLALSLFMLIFVALAHAQDGAKLTGTVIDGQGKGVGNALVTVKGGGVTRTARADANGAYSVDGLPAGTYVVVADASSFSTATTGGVKLAAGQSEQLEPLTLSVASVAEQITVNSGIESIAAETAPSGGFVEERSAQSLISDTYVENFTSPIADYGEIVQIVPGTFTLSSDGIGLGQSKTYFRGFPDGDFDIDFDGVPFYDTNSPTHHSWAFFPSQWIGGVDFDRSPGSASTIGPTPFGGSIHLLSKPMGNEQDIRGTASYGTWNTKLFDGAYNSGSFGLFGGPKKSNLFVDIHHMTSDGYQTFNYNTRNGGSLLYQYSFSPRTVLTAFSGVIWLDANTYGLNPTRCQTLGLPTGGTYTCTGANSAFIGAGYKFMMTNNSDPVNWLDYQYNNYHVPTDFEYVGLRSELGHGWYLETKPYTYNYDNAELFTNATPITEATTVNGSNTYNGVKIAPCNIQVVKRGVSALPCGVDKYNSYRKYGETSVLSQTSSVGVFRGGLWYEWARTDRHQYPSDPLNHWTDQALPNFAEQFWTNSYQPYAEYEYHATPKLNITAGTKFAAYAFNVLHHADNGKTVGNLCGLGQTTGCPTTVTDTGTFKAWLPSLDFNYRIHPNFSIYAQAATGSIVPPSNVYDFNHTPSAAVPTPGLLTPPKQQKSTTYQIGTVMKLQRFTLDADAYRVRFQNSYSSVIDPTTSETVNFLQPSSVTQGVEFETTAVLARGLNLYLNATAANAFYVGKLNAGTLASPYPVRAPGGLWVQQTPADTEMQGITYQSRGMDLGFFNKRVGEQRVDAGAYHNQAIISPFSTANAYVNYTVRNHSIFDQTKIRISGNNLLDQHNITALTLAGTSTANLIPGTTYVDPFNQTTTISGSDNPTFIPGRSFILSVTFGFAPNERK